MKRFFRVLLIGFGVILVMCGATVIIGRAQPAAAALPELTTCDGRFCVYGITPNKTVWSAAQTILHSSDAFSFSIPGSHNLYKQSDPFYRLDMFELSSDTEVYPANGLVNELDIYFYDFFKSPGPTAAEMISRLGPPCGVSTQTPGQLDILYPGMAIFFIYPANQILSQRFEPALRLVEVDVFNTVRPCGSPVEGRYVQPWRGFTDYRN